MADATTVTTFIPRAVEFIRTGQDPAAYPIELEDQVVLANRRRLRIRPLRPGEEDTVRELYDHLSPRTRYLRFFQSMPTLPDAIASVLVCVDHRRTLALVAECDDQMGRVTVGLGSFAATDDRSVELGLVVRDDWQRQRVGTELARRVLQAAATRGFDRFIAQIAVDNAPIRKVIRNLGVIASTSTAGGVSEVTFVRRTSEIAEQRVMR